MYSSSWRVPLPLGTQAFRFIFTFLLAIVVLSSTLLITHTRMPDPKVIPPLPDIGFEVFAKIGWLDHVADVCIMFLNIINGLIFFKLFLLHRQHHEMDELSFPSKVTFLKRILLNVWDRTENYDISKCDIHLIAWIRFVTSYTLVLFFRAVVIVMTSYPATDNQCQHPQPITNPLKTVIIIVLSLGSSSNHCGDLMFSGHTIIITLSFMMHWVYGGMLHRIFRPMSTVVVLFAFYCIIASRSHYTDDILVSLYITAATFIAMGHSDFGAPWQLQLFIRWWPCCGSNVSETPADENVVTVVVEDEQKP